MKTLVKQPIIIETRALPQHSEMSERQLVETRNSLMDEMEGLVDTAKIQKRALKGSEENRFNTIRDEIKSIDAQLQSKRLNFENGGSSNAKNYSPEQREEIRSFMNYLSTGVADGNFSRRDLSSGSSGAVIPKTIANMVIQKVKELAPVFDKMTHFNVTGNLSVPSYPWDSHTTAFTTDLQAITTSGGTFLTVDLVAHSFASLAVIGRNLLNRTDVDVVNIIVQQIAMSIANFLSDEIINGTTFSGGFKSITQTQTAAGATTVVLDDLIGTQMKVPSVLQANSVWVMHPDLLLMVRKLKDAQGYPLLLGDDQGISADLGFTLLGRPVYLDENVNNTFTTGEIVAYYGDPSGFICNTNMDLTTQVLQERYIDVNAVGVISGMDLDINFAQSRSMAVLKLA